MYNQIRTSDVELSLDQSYISIRIAKSKTLQHNAAVTLKIPKSEESICPVQRMREYLAMSPVGPAAFCHKDSRLTRY
ncbi:hypothetical protein DPMN_134672 [Dreissena polymorpha]|uniref:Uncharacterized protein n=1 Tax=Dreissena polymorpha TaxID=45954 RepID=A0A9D4G0C3_DREPO|nr:hypothetical protein DPMN_134672 [Dreissena polymorpha]